MQEDPDLFKRQALLALAAPPPPLSAALACDFRLGGLSEEPSLKVNSLNEL